MQKLNNCAVGEQQGFVLVTALLILVVLTIIGIAATSTTRIELQIAGNDKTVGEFFITQMVPWNQPSKFWNKIFVARQASPSLPMALTALIRPLFLQLVGSISLIMSSHWTK